MEYDLSTGKRQDDVGLEVMKEQGRDRRENMKQSGKTFESAGNDLLEGGVRLSDFNPRIG